MKKIFFTYLIYCFAWQANAQSNNTIVNDNSSWAILGFGYGSHDILCCVNTDYVFFDGDSIVAEASYKKVFSCDDRLHENIRFEGLMREQDEKTYFIPAKDEAERVLYDFSLEEGTTFEYCFFENRTIPLYVKSVDFIEVNGYKKKRIQIGVVNGVEGILDTWIEEIGSLNGLLYPCSLLFLGGGIELLCYYQNDELVYKNPTYSECYYDKPEDLTSVQTIPINDCSIFPNPVDDIITVSCLSNTILRIEIFNNIGQKVYSQTNDSAINVSSFPKGVYLLKMYDVNEQVSVFKIIKK